MWWHFVSGSASLPQIKEAVWPCSIILCLLLVSPRFCRTLGGVQKSCWTQLSTWATSASATWNTSPSLSPPQPTLPSHSCLSTPTSSTHPPSPCTPTRASPPRFLRRRSSSPRSNPCDMPHNFSLCKRQHDSATKKKRKEKSFMENSDEQMCIHPHLASVYFPSLTRVFIRRDENASPLCYCALLAPHWGCL